MRKRFCIYVYSQDINEDGRETTFKTNDLNHAHDDYLAECSIQAKYRSRIAGYTSVRLIELDKTIKELQMSNEDK